MLKEKGRLGETTHVRDITVYALEFEDAYTQDGEERLIMRIVAEYNVWVTRRGRPYQGTPDTRHRMTYIWTMTQPVRKENIWVIRKIENIRREDLTKPA